MTTVTTRLAQSGVVQSAAAQRFAGSIPAQNRYMYGLQIVILVLAVCVCELI